MRNQSSNLPDSARIGMCDDVSPKVRYIKASSFQEIIQVPQRPPFRRSSPQIVGSSDRRQNRDSVNGRHIAWPQVAAHHLDATAIASLTIQVSTDLDFEIIIIPGYSMQNGC